MAIVDSSGSSRDTWGTPHPMPMTQNSSAAAPEVMASATSLNALSAAAIDSAKTAASARILVIESDVETADVVVELLEAAGYQVEVATDGSFGLLLAESFAPDVILIGSDAQRLNGHELTQTLRNAPQFASRFQDAALIYIADNRSLIQQRFDALPNTPLSAYILKPIDAHELLQKVSRVLSHTRLT